MEFGRKSFLGQNGVGLCLHEGQAGLQMQQVKRLYSGVERCVMVAERGRTDCVRRGHGKVEAGLITSADSAIQGPNRVSDRFPITGSSESDPAC